MRRASPILLALALLFGVEGQAKAGLVFVGQWQVDQGPDWPTQPLIMSGQDVAALLFGGSPSDYSISTVDSNPANVNHMTWHSGFGSGDPNFAPILPNGQGNFPAGSMFAEGLRPTENGNTNYLTFGDYSAYIRDWAVGPMFTNYAFRNEVTAVPEPATMTLLGIGIAGMAGYGWRRRKQVVA